MSGKKNTAILPRLGEPGLLTSEWNVGQREEYQGQHCCFCLFGWFFLVTGKGLRISNA